MANLVRTNVGLGTPQLSAWDPWTTMQQWMRWDPFEDTLPDLFRAGTGESALGPRFEVKETHEGYVVKADLPGMEDKDVSIELLGSRLTISGQRQTETEDEGDAYFTRERGFGSFMRSFTLPEGLDADRVKAELKDGVLTVHLPKSKEARPRRISTGGGLLDKVKETVKEVFGKKESPTA